MPDDEISNILCHCHSSSYGGHFGAQRTAAKVLQTGFFWSTLSSDAHAYVTSCDQCQRVGNISRRHEWPLNNIIEVKIIDVWGINFIGPFPPSFGQLYIFLTVDYMSK